MQTWVVWPGLRYWQVCSPSLVARWSCVQNANGVLVPAQFPQLRPGRSKKGSDTRWSFRRHYCCAGGLTDLNAGWPSQGCEGGETHEAFRLFSWSVCISVVTSYILWIYPWSDLIMLSLSTKKQLQINKTSTSLLWQSMHRHCFHEQQQKTPFVLQLHCITCSFKRICCEVQYWHTNIVNW